MRKQSTYMTDLICSDCGNMMTISRKTCKSRGKFHIKDMYCVKCDKETKFIELINADFTKKELEFKEELTDIEKMVYDLTHKESENKVLCKKNI